MTRQNRVILLSDGNATEGITDPAKMASLAAANARLGVGLTTIGLGEEFDIETMRTLAEVGAGNFYFLEDPEAVKEVFTDEVKTFMVPIATDVTISLAVGDDYALGNVYGTNGFSTTAYGGLIEIPALFLAGRTDASDPIEEGRRGGGGAILIELIPVGDIGSAESPEVILDVDAGWTDPLSGAGLSQLVPVTEEGTPGFIPEDGYFTDFTVEKAFVMLNLYVGFLIAAELAEDADLPAARGVLEALQEAAGEWVADNADPDIVDDLTYVDLFIDNLLEAEAQMGVQLPPPLVQPDPWPAGD
jgi:Ca-activated chloride channel homolog